MVSWFIVHDGKEQGPFSGAELKARVIAGTLLRDDFVRRDDMQTPMKASVVKGLFPDTHTKVREAADSVGETAESVKKVAANTGKVADAINEVVDTWDKLRKAATTIATVAGGIAVLSGSVGDFLRPLGKINLALFLLAGATTPVLIWLSCKQSEKLRSYKFGVAAVAAFSVTLVFGLWSAPCIPPPTTQSGCT
jgi:GYF domain 2